MGETDKFSLTYTIMTKTKLIILTLTLCVAVVFDASARYRGDLNGDDRVDLADMVYLTKAIKDGSTDKALDVNASGSVDDYDLHKLADIIISGKMTEESGMNVGIGGWGDAGEDFGGTVKAPALTTRSSDETRFYMRNPKSEGDDRYSMEFGVSGCNEPPAAVLFSVHLPREMGFDVSKIVELDPVLSITHELYGTPKFVKENENDDWSDHVLRFIVFSPELDALPVNSGKFGYIHYSVSDCWGEPYFKNCQVAVSGSGDCFDIPEHGGNYHGNFKPVEVSSVWFDESEMNLVEGDVGWLYANIEPWNATDENLVWSSSDERVAIIYKENGREAVIHALKEGEAIITATSHNGISTSCVVRVEKRFIDVWDIYLSQEYLTVTEGESADLTATIYPEDATDQTVEWWSSDDNIALIYAEGAKATVTGLTPGYAEIYASASNGMVTTCYVEVVPRIIEMQSIELDTEVLELEVGDTHQFVVTVYPSDTTGQELEWWVEDETVAVIDQNGCVTMVGEGFTTVHVRSIRWNHVEAVCRINVTDAVEGIIADDAPCNIYTTDGQLLHKAVTTSEIQYLDRGVYLIRQGGKTAKLLK